jgi:hypothetical protein
LNYRIRIKGYLKEHTAVWLDGLEIRLVDGNTDIYGDIQDQSALFGLLKRIQDKGIYLISVNQEEK